MRKVPYIALALVTAAAATIWLVAKTSSPRAAVTPKPPAVARETHQTDRLSTPALQSFVQTNAHSADPSVQDEVGRARIRLAYKSTQKKDYAAARQTLLTAAHEYRGTGQMGSDFGGIPDQAAYQAAVCLVGEGKKDGARKEFIAFMRDHPLSPLVHAAYGRLNRLNGGQPDEEGRKLLDAAVAKQEARIKFETSVCGPKAIEFMLPLLGKPTRDYHELAKLCGTTDKGTTLEGMRKGLSALGIATYGLQVNRHDITALKTPFVILQEDHYLVATEVTDRAIRLFDPRDKSFRNAKLPPAADPKFGANVLVTQVPTLNSDQP
jgi:hypothetical protein